MSKKKINIVNNKEDGFNEMAIRGDIDLYDGSFIANQITHSKEKKIRKRINSIGGYVDAGMSIVTSMVLFQEKGGIIETINEGAADSTAGWIFACGSKGHRRIMQFASMLLHPPMYADGVGINDLAEGDPRKDLLEEAFDKLINIFVPITGRNYQSIRELMLNNTVMDANTAVAEGFADQVIYVSNSPTVRNGASREQIMNMAEAITIETTPDSGHLNKSKMKKTALLVNLNPEASEEAIEAAVRAIINRAEKAEADLATSNASLADMTAKHDVLKNEAQAQKDEAVINYVDAVVKADPSKLPQKEALLNMAKADFETFKTISPLVKADGDHIIDKNIKPDPNKPTVEAEEIEKAKEFFNLGHAEKIALKNTNYNEYVMLGKLYEKHYNEIVK